MSDRRHAAFPTWVTNAIADQAQASGERIEAMFGADAAAESYDIADELRRVSRSAENGEQG